MVREAGQGRGCHGCVWHKIGLFRESWGRPISNGGRLSTAMITVMMMMMHLGISKDTFYILLVKNPVSREVSG